MKYFDWDTEKNEKLKAGRNILFEEIVIILDEGGLIEIVDHPNKKKYPSQKMYVINVHDYIHLVPFVEDEQKIFLKTIIPSRKATKNYLIKKIKS